MIDRIPHGPILELRLNHPPANALTPDVIDTLEKAIAGGPADGADAIIISGQPGMFTAGLDVPYALTLGRTGIHAMWSRFFDLLRTVASSPVPVAAAITGHSPAGGAVLALFCDYRAMAADSSYRIGLNEVHVGISLPRAIFFPLQRLVGLRPAEKLAVGGLMMDPENALAVGLVDEVAPAAEVVERATRYLEGLLALPRATMLATRRALRRDLVDCLSAEEGGEIDRVVDEWFGEETQAALTALVDQLKTKKKERGRT